MAEISEFSLVAGKALDERSQKKNATFRQCNPRLEHPRALQNYLHLPRALPQVRCIRPKTSLAEHSTRKVRCSNWYDRVASRPFLCQLCEADLRRQIRIDSESDRRHATDMPAHPLSSPRR